MDVGFTGTREGMTLAQDHAFRELMMMLFNGFKKQAFHHGGASGADTSAADIARLCGWTLVPHLPTRKTAAEYLARNHDIVMSSDIMIAAPRTLTEEQRSGTWATVRYARQNDVPVIVLDPGKERK